MRDLRRWLLGLGFSIAACTGQVTSTDAGSGLDGGVVVEDSGVVVEDSGVNARTDPDAGVLDSGVPGAPAVR